MKQQISPQYICYIQNFVTAVALLVGVATFPVNQASANNMQQVSRKVSQLKKSNQRWIQVDLSEQRLIAWKGNKAVFGVIVSTGKRSTPTPIGVFNIYTKLKSTRMKGDGYDIPNVPHTMYYQGGYGIHGAFWHNNFGTQVSHGCVNLAPNQAKKLFNWASVGTTVVVQK